MICKMYSSGCVILVFYCDMLDVLSRVYNFIFTMICKVHCAGYVISVFYCDMQDILSRMCNLSFSL